LISILYVLAETIPLDKQDVFLVFSLPVAKKRKIAGSIYPKNLCFDGKFFYPPTFNFVLKMMIC